MRSSYLPGKRKESFRSTAKIVYLFCEGKKTEPNYFNSINRHFRIFLRGKYRIEIVPNEYTDPVGIVNKALEKINTIETNDKIWCIFDVNSHTEDEIQRAVAHANNKVKILLSNPKFELWFLLHYEYTTAYMKGKDLDKRLKKYIENYIKSGDTFSLMKENPVSLSQAIENARQLNDFHNQLGTPLISARSNPSTQVFRLFELLGISSY